MESVAAHWDRLVLRAYSSRDGRQRIYREGAVAGMLTPDDLLERYRRTGRDFAVGTAMFCGTLAIVGGMEYGDGFEIELEDTVRKRGIRHGYRVRPHAIASRPVPRRRAGARGLGPDVLDSTRGRDRVLFYKIK